MRQGVAREKVPGVDMSNHWILVEGIFEFSRDEPQCELDELILSCGNFPWHQVWREIAHLQRVGKVSITAKGGQYMVRPSSPIRETRTVHRERLRRRLPPQAGVSSLSASLSHRQ